MESIGSNVVHFDVDHVRVWELFDREECNMYSIPNRYH